MFIGNYYCPRVSDPDPFGPVSFRPIKRIRVARNQPKSWTIFTKIDRNPKNIIHFFESIKFCLTDIIIYLVNNKAIQFLEKYIFDRKKSFLKDGIFLNLGRIWSRIRIGIQIRIKTKRIRNTDRPNQKSYLFTVFKSGEAISILPLLLMSN